MVFRSAVIPAPDEGSKPAMDRTTAGGLRTTATLTERRSGCFAALQERKIREDLQSAQCALDFYFHKLTSITLSPYVHSNVHNVHYSLIQAPGWTTNLSLLGIRTC